jgi:3-methyl-2-oxobutanoate hydroxymethyltransferase
MTLLDTRKIRSYKLKNHQRPLQMLTCYDYQTSAMLNETSLDLILVGDSLGNVILGFNHTVSVELSMMCLFAKAVKKGAPQKFVVADLPFGTYNTLSEGLKNATQLFQQTEVEAIKLEGAFPYQLELITRLTQIGIPVMGHIGLTPQSVHEQGGYFTHGKDEQSKEKLFNEAIALEKAGVFAIVLECIDESIALKITENIKIPTIGIGSGNSTDGQVLVINDLLGLGKNPPPKFVKSMANLFQIKKDLITEYLK